jgi:hypothetical protein
VVPCSISFLACSCLRKKANEEREVSERQVKDLESKTAHQENSKKHLKQRSCTDTEENKKSEQRDRCENKGRKPALSVSQTRLEETERDQGNLVRLRHPASLKRNR